MLDERVMFPDRDFDLLKKFLRLLQLTGLPLKSFLGGLKRSSRGILLAINLCQSRARFGSLLFGGLNCGLRFLGPIYVDADVKIKMFYFASQIPLTL